MTGSARAYLYRNIAGRDRSRLELARATGYLNAICASRDRITDAHGFWCWRMRLPLVWCERKTPRSRYGRVHLDLFTTAHALTGRGQEELRNVAGKVGVAGVACISPYDAHWEDVPLHHIEELAAKVFRTATRPGNYTVRLVPAPEAVRMARAGSNVLPWRIPA